MANVTKTFSTVEAIYKEFKKTCTEMDENVGETLTRLMQNYLDSEKTPIKEKLDFELKKSNSNDLGFFADPRLWIEYVLSLTEDDMKKLTTRIQFFRWLHLIQRKKLKEELGREINIVVRFSTSKEGKALASTKVWAGDTFSIVEKEVNGMYDVLSPYFKMPKERKNKES